MEAHINFSYKDERENPQTIRKLGPISIPDYQKFLEDSVREKKLPLPSYTHMTRLWDIAARDSTLVPAQDT